MLISVHMLLEWTASRFVRQLVLLTAANAAVNPAPAIMAVAVALTASFYGECCPDISVTKNCFVEECEHGAVRLVGGLTDSTGRLELCALGVWGKVCNAFGYWGPDNARVVCRQLGFSKDGAYTLKDDIERFGTSGKDAVIGEVHCIGTESGLLECSHSSIGFHYCSPYYLDYDEPDIVISCYDEVRGCGDGEVRLDGGFTSSTGRVEVCMDRRWGGVCSDGFDMKDARVVCSELDFNPGDGAIIEGPVTLEASPVFVGSVTCTGSEQSFSECSHNRPPSGGCSVAAISCGMSSSNQPRCTETFPTSVPDIQSYGECLVYKSETAICEGVVRLGIDHVYARSRLGDQNTIAQLLNENLKTVVTVIADHNDLCVKQVLRVLCNFYLPPCGNSTHPVPPSSICQEECHMVQEKCQKTWDALYLAFRSVAPILNCNDTSSLLFPIPHCCTGAGLGISPGDQDSSQQGDNGGDVAGVVSSVIVVILLLAVAAAGAVLLLVVLPRRHKRKRMERMQLDILALPGNDAPILASVTETAMTTHNIEMEPGEKGAAMGASVVTYNPYRKTYRAGQPVSMKASDDSSSSLQVPESRNRVPTYHMRELARGKFLLNIDDITLLDCIGEGSSISLSSSELSSVLT
ncbi:Neurotrypsin, partial [Geodia barretti]